MRAASLIPDRTLRALVSSSASTVVLKRMRFMPSLCHRYELTPTAALCAPAPAASLTSPTTPPRRTTGLDRELDDAFPQNAAGRAVSWGVVSRAGLWIRVMLRMILGIPRVTQPGCGQIPVRPDFAGHLAQIAAQVLERRSTPEPIAVVDGVDHQPGLEHERVRDHRVVAGIGVFLDLEILLDLAPGVGKKRPLRADRGPELVGFEDVVGTDRHDLGVGDCDLRVVGGQLQVPLVVLGQK